MTFDRITFVGPPIDDAKLLASIPSELSALLLEENGFIAFAGGLHIRGACSAPAWHSLRYAWLGEERFSVRYPTVRSSDVPFGDDALGDQFLLRDGIVHRLSSETSDVASLEVGLDEFIERAKRAPIEYLHLQPLVAFEANGGTIEPGQLLSVYPPYCTSHEGERSMRAIDARDHLGFLASFAEQIRDLQKGAKVQIRIVD